MKNTPVNTARSRVRRVINPAREADFARKSADSRTSLPADDRADSGVEPGARSTDAAGVEIAIDGRISATVEGLLNAPLRNDRGQFVRGILKTFEHSEAFWVAVEPIKAGIVERTRRQLAIEDDDGIETLANTIDAYAEATLLRKATFRRMCQQGGPVTNKGRTRGLLLAWAQFFDRELRCAERLGLVRKSRRTQTTPIEWLESLNTPNTQQQGEDDGAPDEATARPVETQQQTRTGTAPALASVDAATSDRDRD